STAFPTTTPGKLHWQVFLLRQRNKLTANENRLLIGSSLIDSSLLGSMSYPSEIRGGQPCSRSRRFVWKFRLTPTSLWANRISSRPWKTCTRQWLRRCP